MAIKKKFIHFDTKSIFSNMKLSANENNTLYQVGGEGDILSGVPDINYQSIVYIKDTHEIWTHGKIYIPPQGPQGPQGQTIANYWGNGTTTGGTNNISASYNVYATGFFQGSDDRLKKYVDDVNINIDKLNKIPIKKFIYNNDKENIIRIGTSAQELQKICPELVNEDENGMLGVNYKQLSLLSVMYVKKLHDKINDIKLALIRHKISNN